MSKTLKKVDKLTLTSLIIAIVVAVAIVITAIFGVNYASTEKDSETLTVTISSYLYDTENNRSAVEDICEAEFNKQGVKAQYTQYGEMSGTEDEIVYVFEKGTALDKTVEALNKTFEAKTAENGAWYGFDIVAHTASETVPVKIAPVNYILTAVAVAVFAIVAFIYVALRFRVFLGGLTAIAVAVSALATTAVILVTRFPFTYSVLSCITASALLTTVFVLLSFGKLRTAMRAEAEKKADDKKPAETLVAESVAWKEILTLTVALAVAIVLVGAIATASTRWFALGALIALAVSTAISVFFVPALCVPMMVKADKNSLAKSTAYIGAKPTKKEAVEEPKTSETAIEE